jgi:hypothetical protein
LAQVPLFATKGEKVAGWGGRASAPKRRDWRDPTPAGQKRPDLGEPVIADIAVIGKPETSPATVSANTFLIFCCIWKDHMGEGKGLILRAVDLCCLFRRKNTSAQAAKHSLALLLVWI